MIPDDPDDPILQASRMSCTGCGREAYPVDAAWLTGDLVLATFTQPHGADCRGPRAWTVIIDTADDHGQTFALAPAGNARRARDYYRQHSCRACGTLTGARYCAACRCQAQTTRGRRCANRAGPGGYCANHLTATGPGAAAASARPGRRRKTP